MVNALGQTAMGAGTEIIDNYSNSTTTAKLVYLGIENIHVVRESFNKLYDACSITDFGASSRASKEKLEKSGWLRHIKTILDGTLMIVSTICSEAHVLIHCSDGWDRTAQLSSLAQICLDPYYRTIDGLLVLLEKEWVNFGHKFQDRCGHLGKNNTSDENSSGEKFDNTNMKLAFEKASKNMFGAATKLFQGFNTTSSQNNAFALGNAVNEPQNNPNLSANYSNISSETVTASLQTPKEISPVFPQFFDCLYQIWKQYPTDFEYDEKLLEFLFTSAYSCEFGTFIFNNLQELNKFKIKKKTERDGLVSTDYFGIKDCTYSIAQYVDWKRADFINNVFTESSNQVLQPYSENLSYWSTMYKISSSSWRDEEELSSSITSSSLGSHPTPYQPLAVNNNKPSAAVDIYDPQFRVSSPLRTDASNLDVSKRVEKTSLSFNLSAIENRSQSISLGVDGDLVDLQNLDIKGKSNPVDVVVENPLMRNPWA